MAEHNHLENRTMQLVKRVESLLNNLPEQGESLEARKLKHITSFNESLAKELETIKAECQEKLRSTSEKETAAARALDDAVEKSRVLSEETEQLRKEAEALQKNHTENFELSKKLEDMISSASSERHSLEKERESIGSRATELTKREGDVRAGLEQLGRDRTAGLYELEQARIAHENRVKEDDARIQQQSEELEQSRLAHDEVAREDLTRVQEQSRQLDGKEGELNSQAEEIALQKQGIIKELQKLENDKIRLSTQSAEVTRRHRNLEAREKTLETREERLQALQKKVADSENRCKEFVTAHNGQVDLFEKTCADYMDKQKQIDNEKAKVSTKDGIITAVKAQLREEQQTVDGLRVRLSKAESKLGAQDVEMKALKQTSAEKGKELGEILGLLQTLNISGETMNSATDIIRESTESVRRLESELSSRLKALDAVEEELKLAQANISELTRDAAAKDEATTTLEQDVSALTQQKAALEQQLSASERQKSSAEEQVSALKQARQESAQEAERELSERTKDIQALRDDLSKLQRQVQYKTSELSATNTQLQALERDLQGEKEKNKSMAHSRIKYSIEEDRHKSEIDRLTAEHHQEIQRLKAEQDRAVEALEAKHAREMQELEATSHSQQQRTHRRSLPLLTPSTTGAASFCRPQATEPSEWQELLDSESAQIDEAHNFLRSIEPSIAYEDSEVGNFSLKDLLPHVVKMAQTPAYRERFETYLESEESGWFCFVLVGKLGHSDEGSRPTQRGCSYSKHRYNCIQVRLQEEVGPRRIEFRNFEVE